MTYCECNSRMHFNPEMGKHHIQPKVRRVKGSKPQQTERFVLFCIQEMVRGNLSRAERRGQSQKKRPGEEEKHKRPSPLNPIWQKYSNRLLTADCCYWNLMTAAADSSYSLAMIRFGKTFSVMKVITDYKRLLSVPEDDKSLWNRIEELHWRWPYSTLSYGVLEAEVEEELRSFT